MTTSQYRLRTYGVTGSLTGIYASARTLPLELTWSRTLNRVDTCRIAVAYGHDLERHVNPANPETFVQVERTLPGIVPWRTEFMGLIRRVDDVDRIDVQRMVYEAVSLDWFLLARRVYWNAGTDRRSQWTGAAAATVAADLVTHNLGAGATVAAGRWSEGAPAWPVFGTNATGSGAVTHTAGDQSLLEQLTDIAALHDDAFKVFWTAGSAELRYGPRPLGTDRTGANADRLIVASEWGTLNEIALSTNLTVAPTVVAVRHQQALGQLPASAGSPVHAHTLQSLPGSGSVAFEGLHLQSDHDTAPASDAAERLRAGQRQSVTSEAELNTARLIYGRDFDLGDRFLVRRRTGAQAEAEIGAVSASWTAQLGDVLSVFVQMPRDGVYGV